MEALQPKVGVGVFIRREGQFLVGKRKSAHATGTWGLTGGNLEYLEDPIACVQREAAEECGLQFSTPQLAAVTNDIFPDSQHYITLFYVADWIAGEAQLLEPHKFQCWEWVSWHLMPEPLMLPLVNLKKTTFSPYTAVPIPYSTSRMEAA